MNLIFVQKNDARMNGFAVVKKAPSNLKKIFFWKKKNPSGLFVQIRSSKRCAEIDQEILLGDFMRFRKIVPHSKIINETQMI